MAAPGKDASIIDQTDGWASDRLEWTIIFGSIKNPEERYAERRRIQEGLEKAIRELGYNPQNVPSM